MDIGFGDAVTPRPVEVAYPTLLDGPAPVLLGYPPETVVAEKLQAVVALGLTNTRMKDFYDLWILARGFPFSGTTLSRAISVTFTRRATAIPDDDPHGLTAAFHENPDKQRQWAAFLGRTGLTAQTPTFPDAVHLLRAFLLPPLRGLRAGQPLAQSWPAGGPWGPED